MSKKILLSGIQPSGAPHIGNYFGAMKQYVDMQNDFESYIFIADYHAMTSVQSGEELAANTLNVAIDYLAIGLDPKKVVLFKQSDIPELGELAWIFNCVTTMPFLMRAHAFKDAEAKNHEINVGKFTYPLLMAADILIQQADIVPVGKDQKQHVEIARDTAEKFNRTFGEIFKLPQAFIKEEVATVPGTDGNKMSKSHKNTIPLFADDETIRKAVMSIPTDSKGVEEPKNPAECKVFAIHSLFPGPELEALRERYIKGGIGYKESKDLLVVKLRNFIAPLREKREKFAADPEAVKAILIEGGKKARERALETLAQVRKAVGITF